VGRQEWWRVGWQWREPRCALGGDRGRLPLAQPGRGVVSDLQLEDFTAFCRHVKGQSQVKYLLLGNSVRLIYIMDSVKSIAAESALAGTAMEQEMRDDIRDSWHSPANRRQLATLLEIFRDLHQDRPDLEMVTISGDVHP